MQRCTAMPCTAHQPQKQMAAPGGDTGAGVYGIFERGQAGVGHSGKTLRLDLAGVCWLKDFH